MTNKIFSMVDGKRIGIAPNLSTRLHRVDSVSIVSRQSLLPILLLCLTLFVGVGNAWGDDLYKTAAFTKSSFSANSQSYTGSFNSTTNGFTVAIVNANNNN